MCSYMCMLFFLFNIRSRLLERRVEGVLVPEYSKIVFEEICGKSISNKKFIRTGGIIWISTNLDNLNFNQRPLQLIELQ